MNNERLCDHTLFMRSILVSTKDQSWTLSPPNPKTSDVRIKTFNTLGIVTIVLFHTECLCYLKPVCYKQTCAPCTCAPGVPCVSGYPCVPCAPCAPAPAPAIVKATAPTPAHVLAGAQGGQGTQGARTGHTGKAWHTGCTGRQDIPVHLVRLCAQLQYKPAPHSAVLFFKSAGNRRSAWDEQML